MALTRRTRFMLVQSTSNTNVTEDNMEPYHISTFRRSTSMPPLPKLLSLNKNNSISQEEQQQQQHRIVSKTEKEEVLTNKFYKLNIHTMRKKSARISMRLSSAFGLSAHTIDEQFNFQEQRFRAIEKFLKLFLRNIYICIEALRETFKTQVDVAEDFEELLTDKIPDLAQQFVQSKHSLLEQSFTKFCNHIELYVVHPLNILMKLFISPSNLIAKRHKKLLDYDSAQSSYEKVKHQQLKQAKRVLDLSKRTYDIINNQLVEELPILYESSYQILSICLKTFIIEHFRLMQQMRINIQCIFNQIISPTTLEDLNWEKIMERFTLKNNSSAELLFQLIITRKNFSDKLKNLSITQISSIMSHVYNYDKGVVIQTEEIRRLIKSQYAEKDLYTVIRNYAGCANNQTTNSTLDITVRSGDLVGVINQHDSNGTDPNWLVDNGVIRGYLPCSILLSLSSSDQPNLSSHTPPAPIRQDMIIPRRISLPSPCTNSEVNCDQSRKVLTRSVTEPEPRLINSSHHSEDDNERIYLNQLDCLPSTVATNDYHEYTSFDPDQPNNVEEIYIALYNFQCTIDGVLSLHIGERLKILERLDGDGNKEWWYVEKINDLKQRGYVPANYIQAA